MLEDLLLGYFHEEIHVAPELLVHGHPLLDALDHLQHACRNLVCIGYAVQQAAPITLCDLFSVRKERAT